MLQIGVSKGDSRAMFAIGEMYENGEIVEKSLEKAREYYEKAAILGLPKAMFVLGICY